MCSVHVCCFDPALGPLGEGNIAIDVMTAHHDTERHSCCLEIAIAEIV